MANRVRKRAAGRAGKMASARDTALKATRDIAFDMEEPLRHATWFVRAIEQAGRQGDPEIEALSFVATEARLRLETLDDLWHKLFETGKTT